MTASIQPSEWLQFIAREYLASYIRNGGSALKFAVPLDDALRHDLLTGLAAIADQAGYLVATINAADTKVHMVDEIFFRVAQHVPWHDVSRRILAKLAAEAGYAWVDSPDGPLYQSLAAENKVDPHMLLLDLKKAIGNKLFRERSLPRDFQVAMTHLCIAQLAGGQDGDTAIQALTDWLTGRNKAVSAVKPYQIFRRITRNTARHFFESMAHWIRFAGYPGIVVLMDAQRLMLPRNPRDQTMYYSKATLLDAYEVLRQFIDASERLEGCFLAVVPDITFLEDHARGISCYEALKFRVFDEVRDRSLVNPMASLARISATPQGSWL